MARVIAALVPLVLLLSLTTAQDCEQEKQGLQVLYESCTSEKSTLEQSLAQEKDLAKQWSDYGNSQAALLQQEQAAAQQLQQRIQQLETQSDEVATLLAKIDELMIAKQRADQEVKQAELKLAAYKEKVASAHKSWLPIWLQIKVDDAFKVAKTHINEIVTGESQNEATLMLHKAYRATADVVQQAYTAAKPHISVVKAQIDILYMQAKPHIDKHITSAAWWKALCEQASQVEAELRTFLTSSLKAVPQLAPYADPVTVQLLVYFMFAAPLLTLLMVACALRPNKAGSSYDKLPKTKISQNGIKAKGRKY